MWNLSSPVWCVCWCSGLAIAAGISIVSLLHSLVFADNAAGSLEEFYEWLLLWETSEKSVARPGAVPAPAGVPHPLLQPPPVSLLRQAEEWCLLEDNPPPENYLQVRIHSNSLEACSSNGSTSRTSARNFVSWLRIAFLLLQESLDFLIVARQISSLLYVSFPNSWVYVRNYDTS